MNYPIANTGSPCATMTFSFLSSTGDEDEPDIFDSYLDPLCLLRQMEQGVAQEAEMNPGGAALEPYQVLRNQRAGTRRRQRGGGKSDERGFNVGGGHEDEERWEVEDPAGPSGPDPGVCWSCPGCSQCGDSRVNDQEVWG